MAVALLLAAALAATLPELTDDDLAARAAAFVQTADASQSAVLGTHHGVRVMLLSQCSDLCPIYTVRIVHYDLEPGPACSAKGGRTVQILVPVSVAAMQRSFCVPQALYARQLYTGHPFQGVPPAPRH